MEMLGHIPESGESFQYENLTLTIQEMDDQRVRSLIVQVAPASPKNSADNKKDSE